jgi:phosphoribosylformylglycinamidine cyclo-ligase
MNGRPLGEHLLEPTRIYVREVLAAAATGAIRSAAHVTGGGIRENLPRALPEGLGATLDPSAWERPSVLAVLAEAGSLSEEDVAGTFNLGLGMLLVVDPERVEEVLAAVPDARGVGAVTEEPGVAW